MWLKENTTGYERGLNYGKKGDLVTVIKDQGDGMTLVCDIEGTRFWTSKINLTDIDPNPKKEEHADAAISEQPVKTPEPVRKKGSNKKVSKPESPGLFG